MNKANLILTMTDIIRNIKWGEYPLSLGISVLSHSAILIIIAYLFNIHFERPVINTVYLTFQKNEAVDKSRIAERNVLNKQTITEEIINSNPADAFYNFSKTGYDTSGIKQIYRESTLNVSVRYPDGWTYIDQNVKNKLDGVTFWSVQGIYEVPPYVHLEVQDKYIFNPSRYKYKLENKENTFFYNDPEELEGYYTQIIYVRTDSDEDYSLKLTAKGKETFQAFQPVFFNMAKSFSFGKSFFN